MQLRKRSNHVNYTENGSPTVLRPRRSNSVSENADSEDDVASDETGEGTSGLENSDDTDGLQSAKRPLTSSKRKHGLRRDSGKENGHRTYKKRNGFNADHASSQSSHDEDGDGEDGDGAFAAVNPKRKKRKTLAEPRPRPRSQRAKRSETVNYKDASSSDEGEQGSEGEFDGSFGKARRRGHRSSSELAVDDEDLPDTSKIYYRKKGASNGKMRRVAAPSGESADSLPGKNGEGDPVKCYRRRLKSAVASDDEDDQKAGVGSSGKARGRSRKASDSDGNSSESEEEKSTSSESPDSAVEKPRSKSSFHSVDTFGLRISEDDYGPITKRVSGIEKVIAVRNRSTGVPIFCVKLVGRGYRNVVNVLEAQLQKHCPNLLRSFVKKMHSLGRTDGHPGDHARSPAFNPKYLKVDRIVAMEKNKRGCRYYVKWCSLPYSESTWEREDDLADDVDAIKRYTIFNRKKKKRLPTSYSSKLMFNDGRSLRDYQEEGVSWMADKYENGVNCILADEMGLGKTIQSVAIMETLRLKHGIRGPFLVVAPVSTLGHWQREVESLTDMNCVVYSGTQEDREIVREYEFKYDGDSKSSADMKFNVLLTSFEMLMKDQSKLAKIQWQYVVVDEAHRLKSRMSKTTGSLKQMDVPSGGLLLLTGTPVQNNTKEIFSLLHLLDPESFRSEEEFLAKYGDLRNAEQVKELQDDVLRPRLLRRMKEDVEKSIPQKEETIVWVELTPQQWIYYKAVMENSVGDLVEGSVPLLKNVAMELRKVCNHPLLCDGIEDDLISKHRLSKHEGGSVKGGSKDPISQNVLLQSSGKMILVDKLLPMLKDAGNRVLIFSQFTMMLDLLEDYLLWKGYTYERIDGKIRGSDRQAAIDRYSAKDSDIFVFLLSTRAGGLGITLTAADTCLIYDSDWNPQNDLQAMARCHRIGQTKDVRIYRLITKRTYEERLFECSSRKYGLDEAILGNRVGAADGDLEQTMNIESLLKRGAYDMMKDDGGEASAQFKAENIHEILEHRTQKRLIGGRGVNTFSVATFISHQPEVEPEPNDECKQQLQKGTAEFWGDYFPEALKAAKEAKKKVSPLTRHRPRVRVDYREHRPKAVSDDETYEIMGGNGRESQTEESSVSVESDEDEIVVSWSEREVKRLEDRLMVLGRNHSRQIQQEARVEHRSLLEVEQVSDYLVELCHYFEINKPAQLPNTSQKSPDMHPKDQKPAEVAKPVVAAAVLSGANSSEQEAVPATLPLNCVLVNEYESGVNYRRQGSILIGDSRRPPPPACIRNAMKSQILVDRMARNASRYLQILREREILALAISRNDPIYLPPSVPIRSKKIPSWWGKQEDLDLMIGVNKHGHREFKKVRMDPSLCFAKRMNATYQAEDHVVCVVNGQDGSQVPGMNIPFHPILISNEGLRGVAVPGISMPYPRTITSDEGLCGGAVPGISMPYPPNAPSEEGLRGGALPGMIMPYAPNLTSDEGLRGGDWPPDSVLAARLKKLIQVLPSGSVSLETNKHNPNPDRKHATDLSGNAEKSEPLVAGVTLFHEAVQKVEVDMESLHSRTETTVAAKEGQIHARTSLPTNSDKKEGAQETNVQQRITGYFIPKVVVAT